MIGQKPGTVNLENPKNWRTRSSVHLVMDGLHIQVDAAPEFRIQCIREQIPAVDIFFLTHGHADHIMGMDDLRRYCDMRGGEALPVFSSPDGLQRVKDVFPYAVRATPAVSGYPAFELHQMPSILELPQGTVQSVLLPHGPMQVLGLVFTEKSSGKRIAYYTDCASIDPEAEDLARGADIVVLDALRPVPHPTHMSIPQAIDAAQRIKASQTCFTHMTFQVDHDIAQANLPPGMLFAWDGMRLTA